MVIPTGGNGEDQSKEALSILLNKEEMEKMEASDKTMIETLRF